ncbi:uncharacterized protein LOC141884591 [Acropora palmata]|uniref:uncharacterized protein LOC141884591 n=1 Tax=Acropora palmata TaxID=6131 RepID=UPI003DA0AB0F
MGGIESFLNGSETEAWKADRELEPSLENSTRAVRSKQRRNSSIKGTLEAKKSKRYIREDTAATEPLRQELKLTDKPQDGKRRAQLGTRPRMVSQVTAIKTLLAASFKKDTELNPEYVTIEFAKRPEDRAIDLGFVLHGGVDNEIIPGDPGIFVKHVIAGSVVDKRLRPGDRILFINGINATNVKLKWAQQAVRKAKGMVRLHIKKVPNRQKIIHDAIKKESEQEFPLFSDEDIEGYEDAFSVYDVRGNGLIKVNDVFPLIRSLGHNPLEAAVWCYMNDLGLTANRRIKFTEFLRIMATLITDEEREEHRLDTIRVFDPEERGYINSSELETALKRMPGNEQMTDSELLDIIRLADPDGDGQIHTPDFMSLVSRQQ